MKNNKELIETRLEKGGILDSLDYFLNNYLNETLTFDDDDILFEYYDCDVYYNVKTLEIVSIEENEKEIDDIELKHICNMSEFFDTIEIYVVRTLEDVDDIDGFCYDDFEILYNNLKESIGVSIYTIIIDRELELY